MLSVVIPVYRVSAFLPELLVRLKNTLDPLPLTWEAVLVDDGSGDGTLQILESLRERYKNVGCLGLKFNCGQQTAVLAGLRAAKGDLIVTMDADLQHPPEEIPSLLSKMAEGYDAVYGVMKGRRDGFIRSAGSRLHDLLFNIICSKPKSVRVSSFRIIKKEVAKKICGMNPPFVYISAMMFRVGNFRVCSIYIPYVEAGSPSAYSIGRLISIFWKLAVYYSPLSSAKGLYSAEMPYIIQTWLPPLVS